MAERGKTKSEIDQRRMNMRKSIKTAIFACVFAVAFQITAFASFSWKVENAESSYVGTTNVTVTNTSGKKERNRRDVYGGGSECDLYGKGI